MNAIKIKIAGFVGEIRSEYPFGKNVYREFRTTECPDFVINLTDEDIDFRIVSSERKSSLRIKLPCILKKYADELLLFDTVLMHGVAICNNNSAYLFTAPSRTGKTTHAELWLKNCPGSYIVNGDKPFIRIPSSNSFPIICGSPWAGKENMYTNTMVPLKAIICMERAERNCIQEIPFSEAFPFLLQQIYRPEDEFKMKMTLKLLQRLNSKVRFYRFQCNNFKDDCFNVAYSSLNSI